MPALTSHTETTTAADNGSRNWPAAKPEPGPTNPEHQLDRAGTKIVVRAFLWRHRRKLTLATLPLAVAALVCQLTDRKTIGLALLAGYIVLAITQELISWRCKPPAPELTTEESSAIRTQRDTEGEVAAIRKLREAFPDLGILKAATMVKQL
ncbi:MAG: hypothetical protein H0V92_04120 [Pseudonocardiales bacterium]|nr:hypothetical protein [Pseudonocardiales bacterium]